MSMEALSGRNPLVNTSPTYTSTADRSSEPRPIIMNEDQVVRMERQGQYVTLGEEQLIKAIDRAVKALEGPNTTFEVSVHKQTNSIMVKVLNKNTGELIREIPPEKTLDLVAKMMEFAGILVDERV